MMEVMEFGGTSVGSPGRMKGVASLITKSGEPTLIMFPAMSGTTNTLIEISDYLYRKNPEGTNKLVNNLGQKYLGHVEGLCSTEKYKRRICQFLTEEFNCLRTFIKDLFTPLEEKSTVAQDRVLSTNMVINYLQKQGIKATLLSVPGFMCTDKNAEPDEQYIKEHLTAIIDENQGYQIYITQGFVCRNACGGVDNLQRGGSDYTALLVGAAINAEEIQIWANIDGIHNNDPRVVEKMETMYQLDFGEISGLTYFSARILHPTCVQPARYVGIPVRLKNMVNPDAKGTIIDNTLVRRKIKVIIAKDNITTIKVKSSRISGASGFLCKVFEIFESYQTSIDTITTSEVGVPMAIENNSHLAEIVDELEEYSTVTIDIKICIVCVAGDLDWSSVDFEVLATDAMEGIPIRMISYSGSNFNTSFLIREGNKKYALQSLSTILFN